MEGKRAKLAMAIHGVSAVAMLAVAWQAVRFIMGDIGNVTLPVFELFGQSVQSSAPGFLALDSLSDMLRTGLVWFAGCMVWLMAAVVVGELGKVAARVAAVGWHQYLAEAREATEAAKDRRELRRKVIDAREPRKSSGVFTFVIGLLLGSFFL
ncbi:hypothetical protein [Xanthomonas euvesicatoria]|uniref:hypothetical protein n=1 Tax=Xanthomonas euvesicatoria TaxID=456327 RepID=UPI001C488F46|nr:hypothetical protein [Xanthomonas euvesicatoria]MBV6867885.1 hypothetical protein [Xanthomonas campestris pv. coriandri]MCE4330805.1 hypothetical protein [Xanthomonas campestris pv. coriandri]